MKIVERFITKNYTKGRMGNKITGIVLHTEGVDQKIDSRSDRSLYGWFETNSRNVSAHYYITFSGVIEQYVRLEDAAHHTAGDGNQNVQTIGIEHQDNGYWSDGSRYTKEQYEASARLIEWLCAKYGIPVEIKKSGGIALHKMHDPKPCPGSLDVQYIIERITNPKPVTLEERFSAGIKAHGDILNILTNWGGNTLGWFKGFGFALEAMPRIGELGRWDVRNAKTDAESFATWLIEWGFKEYKDLGLNFWSATREQVKLAQDVRNGKLNK